MKIKVRVIQFCIITIALNLIPQGVIKAASSYDTVVGAAPYWKVVDSLGISHDTTIEDAIENTTNSQLKANCEAAYAKFMQMDYRAYDLYQPSRYSSATYARVFATDETPGQTQWSVSGPVKYANSLWHNTTLIALEYNETDDKVMASNCNTSDQYSSLTYGLTWNDGFTPSRTHLTENFQIDYPTGYAGLSVPSASRSRLIEGNVTCANSNNIISNVYINAQSGLDGNAKISDDGSGGKNYRYYLSENSPYSLVVLCDRDSFYGPTVTTDLYDNYDWICTIVSGQNYCAAS